MAKKQRKKRQFSGMTYREVQRSNSQRRSQLSQKDQKWLRENGYRNVGWDQVIALYQKINDLVSSSSTDDLTLEELFLKADRIGSKYQTAAEIEAFEQALSAEVDVISQEIEKQFPEHEPEFVDYSQKTHRRPQRRTMRKHRH
jgi:hypothetical protein